MISMRIVCVLKISVFMCTLLAPLVYGNDTGLVPIIFCPNGGSGSMDAQFAATGDTVELLPNAFFRKGYTFSGWNTDSLGNGEYYEGSSLFVVETEAQTLFAQWSVNKYTVHLDAQG